MSRRKKVKKQKMQPETITNLITALVNLITAIINLLILTKRGK